MSEVNLGRELRELRENLGLSQDLVAQNLGISKASIGIFERNQADIKDDRIKKKISDFVQENSNGLYCSWILDLLNEKRQKAKEREERKAKELAELRAKMKHSFIAGQSYFIFDSGNAKTDSDDFASNDMKPETGKGCIFVYVRKEGRHHMFKEKRGGWIRTYTDTQLMGKKIREVIL